MTKVGPAMGAALATLNKHFSTRYLAEIIGVDPTTVATAIRRHKAAPPAKKQWTLDEPFPSA